MQVLWSFYLLTNDVAFNLSLGSIPGQKLQNKILFKGYYVMVEMLKGYIMTGTEHITITYNTKNTLFSK